LREKYLRLSLNKAR